MIASALAHAFRLSTKPARQEPYSAGPGPFEIAASLAGETVTPETALNFSAVYAAVNLISDSIKTLPFFVYKRLPNGGKKPVRDHPLYRLLHETPNSEQTPGQFKKFLQASALLWGNGYAYIEQNGIGRPTALWPVHPSRVEVRREDDNEIIYHVYNSDGTSLPVRSKWIYRLMGLSLDGVSAVSVIGLARTSVGFGLALDRHGAQFYGNNAQPGICLTHPGKVSDIAKKNMKESWRTAHGRHGEERYGVTLLEEGVTVHTLGMPHEDAQYLETRVFQVDEIARWFKVPPHKLAEMSKATFSNIEHQAIEYVTDTILPWTIEWEEEANKKLLMQSERATHFTKVQLKGLLRGDAKARGEFYKLLVQNGLASPNQILALEDENPIGEQGDQYFMPMNMRTLASFLEEELEEEEQSEVIPPQVAPGQPQPSTPEAPAPEAPAPSNVKAASQQIVAGVLRRLWREEKKAVKGATARYLTDDDVERFTHWARRWYMKHANETRRAIVAPLRLALLLNGADGAAIEAEVVRRCQSVIARRDGLLGLLGNHKTGTAALVVRQLEIWEAERADTQT